MAASGGLASEATTQEGFQWLKNLPVAPEYHPTLAEFQDPIAYIFKIEREASKYGICKIVPPVLSASKKTAIANLNRSLAERAGSSSSKSPPTFTTRQQQIGFCPRRPRPVQKPVWQSGECYTFQEFETKAKSFERSYLKKCSKKGALAPLEIETLYWKATLDKPFSVEYANDMPGSAFAPKKSTIGGKVALVGDGVTVGETEWNMRGVSRAKGSLLRFMKEEIPGVSSPMVYAAMMFSWFAWHVEDHDLHSLNYLHMGAGKTWYGVPREAAVAFEEVVRVHGYGGEINPLVTFSVLGEKTTVMSPEVIINAGVPCCRLVQNAGEFVVTFPRAYHCGFSHGFNCGEAANIATPEWLRVAKDAAIRRASINYPPMVSHFQLLYNLAIELSTRIPVSINAKPKSSRLKDKQKGKGETLVKELFVKNVIHNNDLLHVLGKGSPIALLPQSSSDISVCSNLRVGSQLGVSPSPGLSNHWGFLKSSKSSVSDNIMPDMDFKIKQLKGSFSVKGKFASLCESSRFSSLNGNDSSHTTNAGTEKRSTIHGDKLSDQRLFSCVTCGILSFDCVAVIQPREAAARYLMSADCSFFNDWIVGSGVTSDGFTTTGGDANTSEQNSSPRRAEKNIADGLYDVPVQSVNYQIQMENQCIEGASDIETRKQTSALGLLALNYGNSSDSEEHQVESDVAHSADKNDMTSCSFESQYQCEHLAMSSFKQEGHGGTTDCHPLSKLSQNEDPLGCYAEHGHRPTNFKDRSNRTLDCSVEFETDNPSCMESNSLAGKCRDPMSISGITSNRWVGHDAGKTKVCRGIAQLENTDRLFAQRSDEDSSCMHIFCLEHAVEVEHQLHQIGGVHILLLCHPEYPRIETEAKLVSEDLGIDYPWNDLTFRDATKEDEERIQSALDCEEAMPGNGDWAVKLGINLFYSANLSRSPLYSKQMPYNSVIYNAFGRTSPASSPTKVNVYGRRPGKHKKVVAGKWCGKVWMSNQVHPFLAKRDSEDEDQEQEQEKSFQGWEMLDEKLERRTENIRRNETTLVTRKFGRKRKMMSESGSLKKVKCVETEDAVSDDFAEDNSHKQPTRVHSRKQTKGVERQVSYDSLEDNSHQHHGRRISRSKHAKSVGREDAVSDDSLRENSYQESMRILRSKQTRSAKRGNAVPYALVDDNPRKQRRRFPRNKQARFVGRGGAVSDDSIDNNVYKWLGTVSMQTKFIEREDAVSGDSVEESSHRSHGMASRSKQARYIGKEDTVSDDSMDNTFCSYRKNRRISSSNQTNFVDSEDEFSYDSLEEQTYQQHTSFPRGKQAKFIEMEEAASDDLLEDKNDWRRRKIRRSRQANLVERGDTGSDDSPEDNTHQLHRRIPRSERAKLVEREDAVSDDSLEDSTHQKHRRIPKSERAKFVESEDAASDDLSGDDVLQKRRRTSRSRKANIIERQDAFADDVQEYNSHQQPRKTNRGKQAKFIETEDAVSHGLLEDKSDLHRGRVLRSKQSKPATLHQMKQAASWHLKQGTSQRMKKQTARLIKGERQVKQETRLRNHKNEPNARRFDLHAKDELEGGPSTRLRKRPTKPAKELETKLKLKQQASMKKVKNAVAAKVPSGGKNVKMKDEEAEYQCDMEGCTMSFGSKQELAVHKRNICPVKGCGKKFLSHKYLVQHRRVHMDDRPLKCPWKGCKMTFKWAWARTEHIRVHTGARPYVCAEEGCGQTFRFVSDFSRHKRKTGHSAKKSRG